MADGILFESLIICAEKYAALNWAVKEQLVGLLDGDDDSGSYNANALELIAEFLDDIEPYIKKEQLDDEWVRTRELTRRLLQEFGREA